MDINFEGTPFNPPKSPMGLLRSGGIISLYLLFFFFHLLLRVKKKVNWDLEWI